MALTTEAATETTGARAAGGPHVSVVVPAYNAAAFVGAALASVFAQTFAGYEVILVNDGSPDTAELERALEPFRARLRYFRQENRGPAAARNLGLRESRGRLVAFLDADDEWLPEFLSEQASAFASDAALALRFADAELFGHASVEGRTFMQLHPSAGEATLENLIELRVVPLTSCVVARRAALVSAGLFDESFSYAEDFHLWARVAHGGGRLGYTRRVLARHRVHAASLTADVARYMDGQLAVYQNLAAELDLSPRERAALERQMARASARLALEAGKRELAAGRFEGAAQDLARANDFYRSAKLGAALLALRLAPRLVRRAYELRRGLWARRAGVAAGE